LLFCCILAHADQRTNWIAFNGTGGVFKYIMAVDEEGNVLVPPTAILSYDIPGSVNLSAGRAGEPANPYKDKRGDTEDGGTSSSEQFPPGPFGPLDGPCAIALDQDGALIKYYLLTAQGSVFRFDIPIATLVPTTPLPNIILGRTLETKTRDFRTLQSTQHVSPPFLAVVSGNIGKDDSSGLDNIQGALQALKFKADGTLKVKGKNISPATGKLDKIGSISADGHMALSNQEIGNGDFDDTRFCDPLLDNDKAGSIYAQPLGSPTPVGPAQIIGNTKPQVGAVDVSNEVVPVVRFAVYATRSSDTPNTQNGDDLILQMIDSKTGAKIGGRHFLRQDVEMVMTFFQGVAIDPEGEFVIWAERPVKSITAPDCANGGGSGTNFDGLQVGNRDSLFFQAIDIRTGEAVGKPILLFSADDGPFDGQSDETNSPPGGGNQEFAFPQINGIDVMIQQ